MSSDLSSLVARLESVTSRLEGIASRGGGGGGQGAENTEIVEAFDSGVLKKNIKTYFDLSAKIGGDAAEQANLVKKAFDLERQVIVQASKYKQPKPDVFQSAIKPLSAAVDAIISYRESHRASKTFNHLSTVSEGIGCLGWVTVSPKPAPYIKESGNQCLFYGNRVIKEFKGKNDTHVQWSRAFSGAINDLMEYVKEYHTTGLLWNPEGGELTGAGAAAAAPPPPPAGGGPPPPPPPAIQPPTSAPSGGGDDTASQRANLFASINKGGDITKGLRKVTDDMKTHKNPNLRATSVVKAQDKATASKPAPKYGSAAAAKKPPVLELQGKKWVVEYQENKDMLEITDTNPRQAIYIYKCTKCTVKISGKVNSIFVDSCKRLAVVFDACVSSCEVVNSQSTQVQITGNCPTVSIDKTDGCQVFLSKTSLNTEIVSAKSSEMNICVPGSQEGDINEFALPEQYKSTWNGKSFTTVCTDING